VLKKVVGLSLVCVILLAVTVGGTWSFLSDTGKSGGNAIQAGTLYLLTMNDGGSAFTSGVTQSLNFTELKPGQSTLPVTIWLKNGSANNINGNAVNFSFSYTKSNGNQNGTPVMTADATAAILQVTALDYNRTTNLLGMVTDWNNNGYIDLQDLQTATNSPNSQLNLATVLNPGGPAIAFTIQLMMRNLDQYGYPIANINDFQGDGVNLTIKFTLTH
jgi:predicted ribosomally synthesized peptide with SipW-like signal peptide